MQARGKGGWITSSGGRHRKQTYEYANKQQANKLMWVCADDGGGSGWASGLGTHSSSQQQQAPPPPVCLRKRKGRSRGLCLQSVGLQCRVAPFCPPRSAPCRHVSQADNGTIGTKSTFSCSQRDRAEPTTWIYATRILRTRL